MLRRKTYRSHYRRPHLSIPHKANRVLNVVLFVFILIVARIWHLSIIQHEQKVEEAHKPQRRTIVEPARRATICDRFNIPLANNRVQYQATILYSQLRGIPSTIWKTDSQGKRTKHYKRKEYIKQLSYLLAQELNLDPEKIEDLIHSKAAHAYHVPFVIKEEISEKEYYRLKMLENDWRGLHVQCTPKRFYPQGRVAADVIGYMGAINREEYETVIDEIKTLETYLQDRENGEAASLPSGLTSLQQVRNRLRDLKEKAYTVNDYVGKTGIEGMFEQQLRGFHGKKSFSSDARGNFLRELPGSRKPIPGQRFLLTISSELQEYAEHLLIQNEKIRHSHTAKGRATSIQPPWIKGGAVVAIDPTTGDVLALATHPRFDPNDFILNGNPEEKKDKISQICRWFENDSYIGEVWDQKAPLKREVYDGDTKTFHEEELILTWKEYLNFIFPQDSPVRQALDKVGTIQNAISLQKNLSLLLSLSQQQDSQNLINTLYQGEKHIPIRHKTSTTDKQRIEENLEAFPEITQEAKQFLDTYLKDIPLNNDKLLFLDLCQILVVPERFSHELIAQVGHTSLSEYRTLSAAQTTVVELSHSMAKELYHDIHFKTWRAENEKTFLKQKRAEEKATHCPSKPYLEHLNHIEKEMFQQFWETYKWHLVITFLLGKEDISFLDELQQQELKPYQNHFFSWQQELDEGAHQSVSWLKSYATLKRAIQNLPSSLATEYLQTMRGYHELTKPLFGQYRRLRHNSNRQLEKHLAAAFYPLTGFGYGRSQAYRQAATQGSLFKLVTSYAALSQRYQKLMERGESLKNLNPLEMIDQFQKKENTTYAGYTSNGIPIPQKYKGGRLIKSMSNNLGKVDLIRALEYTSNPYFSLLAGDVLDDPQDLAEAASLLSYGNRTGISLPGEIKGKIPKDLHHNRTGLYAFAIGQHSLVVTPLQTAVMLSTIANGGTVLKPKIVRLTAGRELLRTENQIPAKAQFQYQDSLALAGIDFPLFVATTPQQQQKLINFFPTETQREIFMPKEIRNTLLYAMQRVANRIRNHGFWSLSQLYEKHPEAIQDYLEMKNWMVGKTSTAEAVETLNLDSTKGASTCSHAWFGAISFEEENPEDRGEFFIFQDAFQKPELVVVVYLRFGAYGKEAAPIAAQVIKKWREIKQKYDKA